MTVGKRGPPRVPASTLQVVNALFQTNLAFDPIVFPRADHGFSFFGGDSQTSWSRA